MTINEAIKALRDYFSTALTLHKTGAVKRPLAWALYQTWRAEDAEAEREEGHDKD